MCAINISILCFKMEEVDRSCWLVYEKRGSSNLQVLKYLSFSIVFLTFNYMDQK